MVWHSDGLEYHSASKRNQLPAPAAPCMSHHAEQKEPGPKALLSLHFCDALETQHQRQTSGCQERGQETGLIGKGLQATLRTMRLSYALTGVESRMCTPGDVLC